ncbi:biotin synthase BioB [Rothia uropygialis]|uniref:biotin synthase BioB n=1 Tax=Kocuria sp. 36 TaxID=1415402 RepID=UPI00101DFF06|nr:biotin synthase BioB [Kocuria sp. 36]
MHISYTELAHEVAAGHQLTRDEALALLSASDAETFEIVNAASILRRANYGNTVKVNYLVNLKSGLCPEDCSYCSQRLASAAEILKYTWIKPEEAVRQASMGVIGGASRVCMVASGKGPTDRDVERVSRMIEGLKKSNPDIEVCACLGILKEGQAERLKCAGADAYNHNLNTSEDHYAEICSTHSYSERVATVEQAHDAGLQACSGLIVGMGESPEQLVDAVFSLVDLDSESIPINFLMPFEGTPLEGTWELTPLKCLRILSMVRFAAPEKEIRMAGGREMHLRSLQSVALHVVNSLFLGDYLTSEGQSALDDLRMIQDAGFVVLGAEDRDLVAEHEAYLEAHQVDGAKPETPAGTPPCGQSPRCSTAAEGAPVPVTIRRRGVGTSVAPNA